MLFMFSFSTFKVNDSLTGFGKTLIVDSFIMLLMPTSEVQK